MLLSSPAHAAQAIAQSWITSPNTVFLDTETTGLGNRDQIVEIAVIDWEGTPLLHERVKPTVAISAEAYAVHGIAEADLRDNPGFYPVAQALAECLAEKLVAIYNAPFDERMIAQSLAAAKRPTGSLTEASPLFGVTFNTRCAMALTQQYLRATRWVSQERAAREFGIDASGAHSALFDAQLTRQIVKHIAES